MFTLEAVGGALAILFGVGHMVGDWLLQSDEMAMNKTTNIKVRAVHCLIYTMVLAGVMFFWRSDPIVWAGKWPEYFLAVAWLYASHFVIDSYKPLFKFRQLTGDKCAKTIDDFKANFGTTRGFVVYVTLDQLFHLLCLLPVAKLVVTLPLPV
ncbi:MAG: DUF3307 domain-containing protein [Armatimonadetes bacterium]|nr:DUF3307 domain-containing protein [Armatimonadota bacterium]